MSVVKGYSKRDFERRYLAGVKAGNGSKEEREMFLQILASWEEKDLSLQKEPLTLSNKGQLLHAWESGHNVHMIQPEVIAEGVKWVLDRWLEDNTTVRLATSGIRQ